KISHETAVAAGVRRIEAVCGQAAEMLVLEQFALLGKLKESLKNPADPARAVEDLQSENAQLKRKIESAEARHLNALKTELMGQVETLGGIRFIGKIVRVSSADSLKKLCFELKPLLTNFVVALA